MSEFLSERFRLLADIVNELARIAGVEPADSLYTTLERLRETPPLPRVDKREGE